MELARGVIIAGKYRLERPLATGGMGSVWVARHTHLDTPVAIKFMDAASASSPVARARFEREAKSSAALRNRHVVQVLDYGVESDAQYLVMELLNGEDLSKRLHRERRLSLPVMSKILVQAARGLRPAHDARVVHRDLKPANLFLARVDDEDEEVVKILDFGIAKDMSGSPLGEGTKTGELMGSPHYMSPEQVRGTRDIDHRSDLWSLAVIAFRAVTGRMPFNGDNVGQVIAQILADPIPVATRVAPDLPPAVDAFFARGFARDRNQRFQTAREMAEAFAALSHASHPEAAGAPVRWTLAGEMPAVRVPLPSYPGMDSVQTPGSTPRTEPTLPPTETLSVTGGLAPNSGAFSPTGGPMTQSALPPVPKPSPLRWLPLGGAIIGVLIGAVAFVAVKPSHGGAPGVGSQPSASAAPIEPSAPQGAPPPADAASAQPAVNPPASGTPSPSASAANAPASAAPSAAPSAKPSTKPAPAKPTPPPSGKKRPNWGF